MEEYLVYLSVGPLFAKIAFLRMIHILSCSQFVCKNVWYRYENSTFQLNRHRYDSSLVLPRHCERDSLHIPSTHTRLQFRKSFWYPYSSFLYSSKKCGRCWKLVKFNPNVPQILQSYLRHFGCLVWSMFAFLHKQCLFRYVLTLGTYLLGETYSTEWCFNITFIHSYNPFFRHSMNVWMCHIPLLFAKYNQLTVCLLHTLFVYCI